MVTKGFKPMGCNADLGSDGNMSEMTDHREGAVKSQEPSKRPKTTPYTISVGDRNAGQH